jgi:hypothetical protein
MISRLCQGQYRRRGVASPDPGDRVPSGRAQYLWARHWALRTSLSRRFDLEPGEHLAPATADHETFEANWNAAWEAWSANA